METSIAYLEEVVGEEVHCGLPVEEAGPGPGWVEGLEAGSCGGRSALWGPHGQVAGAWGEALQEPRGADPGDLECGWRQFLE